MYALFAYASSAIASLQARYPFPSARFIALIRIKSTVHSPKKERHLDTSVLYSSLKWPSTVDLY